MAFIDTARLYTGISSLIGWEGVTGLDTSESGEYYNLDYLPIDTEVIQATIPPDKPLDEYLQEKTKSGVVYLANKLKNNKIIKRASKAQLSNFVLFPNGGWKKNTIAKSNRFCGIAFELRHDVGLNVVLEKIGLQLSAINTDLTIYVYHSSQEAPITTFDITNTSANSFYWKTDNPISLYADDDQYSGGTFYIGYYEADLTGNAIRFKTGYFDFNKGYCSTCGYGNLSKQYSKAMNFVRIAPFYVDEDDYTQGEMFDVEDVQFVYDNNFGFNFGLSINCDITNYLIQTRNQLTTALGNAVAYKILKGVEYSQQNNFATDDLIGSIQVEMNGTTDAQVDTIGKQIEDAVEALTIDQSELGSVCLPCYKKGGVRYGAA